ncbi:hypothetical protein PR048_009193 [Dryococelus australis]|uniref:Integrase catalytic domain-containing protein n=1 Tax=Dryococelus australis TaxID=614101 RepID=A0ABQ9HZ69_9NEOP|nr:hypothetical protein PR048_009193 [Dryococelus australis]
METRKHPSPFTLRKIDASVMFDIRAAIEQLFMKYPKSALKIKSVRMIRIHKDNKHVHYGRLTQDPGETVQALKLAEQNEDNMKMTVMTTAVDVMVIVLPICDRVMVFQLFGNIYIFGLVWFLLETPSFLIGDKTGGFRAYSGRTRIIIPPYLQLKCLELIHAGHQGIVKCMERAKLAVWWVGLSSQLEMLSVVCGRTNKSQITMYKRTVSCTSLGKGRGGFFKHDYYSIFFEVSPIMSLSDDVVTRQLKYVFAQFGIPDVLRADSGSQFLSFRLKKFAEEYNFRVVTSPHYHQ